jgi:hypothetical protein
VEAEPFDGDKEEEVKEASNGDEPAGEEANVATNGEESAGEEATKGADMANNADVEATKSADMVNNAEVEGTMNVEPEEEAPVSPSSLRSFVSRQYARHLTQGSSAPDPASYVSLIHHCHRAVQTTASQGMNVGCCGAEIILLVFSLLQGLIFQDLLQIQNGT